MRDPLTQLFNRAAFDEQLERLGALGLLLGSEPYLLLFDVDHFKRINDSLGHKMGDVVLKSVADTSFRSFLRKEGFVARIGGEEFVAVLPDSSEDGAMLRAERVRNAVELLRFDEVGVPDLRVTVSVGVATLVAGEAPGHWFIQADRALYDAKNSGRNRVSLAPVLSSPT